MTVPVKMALVEKIVQWNFLDVMALSVSVMAHVRHYSSMKQYMTFCVTVSMDSQDGTVKNQLRFHCLEIHMF